MGHIIEPQHSGVRILLIAEQGPSRKAYEQTLQGLDVEYDAHDSPGKMHASLIETPYNGLLIDVPTMIRASGKDKMRVNELLERFPVLRLIYDSQKDCIRGLHYGRGPNSTTSLESFIKDTCSALPARSIRSAQRRKLHLNVWLLPSHDAPLSAGERTVTINVSEVGCFVITSRPWEGYEKLWLVFRELKDKTPVEARIRWRKPWGQSMDLPGLGLKFRNASRGQLTELLTLL